MRMQQSADILRLALRLAGTAEGLTLDEIASEFGVNRRTAERMRDAVAAVFENRLEAIPDGRTKRFRIPGGLDGFMQAPRPEELAELETAARALEAAGARPRAALLQSLGDKVRSAMRAAARRRIEPDVEALLRAEALVLQAGPRPLVDTETLAALREALKAMRVVEFEYPYASGRVRRRKVVPFGLIFGKVYYLVGPEVGMSDPVLWRLDRMTQVRATEERAHPRRSSISRPSRRGPSARSRKTPKTSCCGFRRELPRTPVGSCSTRPRRRATSRMVH
jgi:predicted DNA-binding transcriptional regulator YafY